MQSYKNGKVPSNAGINIDLVKAGGHGLWKAPSVRSSKLLIENTISSGWKESKTVLLYKKGN